MIFSYSIPIKVAFVSLLLIFAWQAKAQEKCVIFIDSETRQHIPYVAVQASKSNIGGYSDEQGKFCYDSFLKSDSLYIMALGYQKRIVGIQEFENSKEILLKNEPLNLSTVEIRPSKRHTINLGWFNLKPRFKFVSYVPNSNQAILAYIAYDGQHEGIIQSVNFRFTPWKSGIAESFRIRLRIMTPSTTNRLPQQDLLSKNVVIDIKPDQKYLTYDLSSFNIPFDQNGVWIGFETVGYLDKTNRYVPILDGELGRSTKKVRTIKDANFHLSPHVEMIKNTTGVFQGAIFASSLQRWMGFMKDHVPMFGIVLDVR